MALYSLAENFDYKQWKEEMICDRLAVGIRDAALSQQLQMDSGLNLGESKEDRSSEEGY